MLVFKNASNPCLIGRDVLAVHPETKTQFNALMNTQECECSNQQSCNTEQSSKQLNDELREYLKTGKITKCKNKHCDRSSEDDGDEMDDILNDNSNTKRVLGEEQIKNRQRGNKHKSPHQHGQENV